MECEKLTEIDERQISFLRQPEPPRIQIKDNPVLEKMANRLLEMIERDPSLLNGISMAEVDRKIYAGILWEDGLQKIIPSDKKTEFMNIVIKTQDSEVVSRARRELLNRDLIRLSASVIKSAEQYRSRISRSMR